MVGVGTPSIGRVVESSPDEPCLVPGTNLALRSCGASRKAWMRRQERAGSSAAASLWRILKDRWRTAGCAWRVYWTRLYPVIMREIRYRLPAGS